jgi:membrane protease YdiL (CAAX protease family)
LANDPPPDLRKELWLASIGILVLLGALKHLGGAVPAIADHAFTAAAAAQLYVPILLIGKRGITKESIGLAFDRWKRETWIALGLGVLTIVPFAIGHHFWRTIVLRQRFDPRLPAPADLDAVTRFLVDLAPSIEPSAPLLAAIFGALGAIAIELLVVALPEELYFRGYLLGRFELLWPAKRRLFGAPFGKAIVVSSVVFALAHFVGEYRIDRLGPFFPALLFGLLRSRSGSVVAPIAYHAFCNLLSQLLTASYRY